MLLLSAFFIYVSVRLTDVIILLFFLQGHNVMTDRIDDGFFKMVINVCIVPLLYVTIVHFPVSLPFNPTIINEELNSRHMIPRLNIFDFQISRWRHQLETETRLRNKPLMIMNKPRHLIEGQYVYQIASNESISFKKCERD